MGKVRALIFAVVGCAVLVVSLVGCAASSSSAASSAVSPGSSESAIAASAAASSGSASTASSGGGAIEIGSDENTTDQVASTSVSDAELYVAVFDGRALVVDSCEAVDTVTGGQLEDGHFYKVVADVTYLNGGVAGYVDYPKIEQVKSCDEVPFTDLNLPSIRDKAFGLVSIGDYADGDVLLREYGMKAVWKDGAWVYRYDAEIALVDGSSALVRKGVTEADVQAGIGNDVLSCADYFVLPPKK